jgi:hypothetical protein
MKLTANLIFLCLLLFSGLACRVARISNLRIKAVNGHYLARERKLKTLLENFTGGNKEAELEAQRKYTKQKNTLMLLNVMSRQRKIKKISFLVESLQDALENLKASVESEVGQLSSITQAASGEDRIVIGSGRI